MTLDNGTPFRCPQFAFRVLVASIQISLVVLVLGTGSVRTPGIDENSDVRLGQTTAWRLKVVQCIVVEIAAQAFYEIPPNGIKTQRYTGFLVPLEYQTKIGYVEENEHTLLTVRYVL